MGHSSMRRRTATSGTPIPHTHTAGGAVVRARGWRIEPLKVLCGPGEVVVHDGNRDDRVPVTDQQTRARIKSSRPCSRVEQLGQRLVVMRPLDCGRLVTASRDARSLPCPARRREVCVHRARGDDRRVRNRALQLPIFGQRDRKASRAQKCVRLLARVAYRLAAGNAAGQDQQEGNPPGCSAVRQLAHESTGGRKASGTTLSVRDGPSCFLVIGVWRRGAYNALGKIRLIGTLSGNLTGISRNIR
jgi:hypothetical protein